jgi:hypothetical protein
MLLKKCKYSSEIEEAIVNYTGALDLTNYENAFLRLWSILEHLTNTGYDSYKVTIRRASFLFEEEEYTRQVLKHLKDYRNRSVHLGTRDRNIETFLFQLKEYIEALLSFHLANKFRFNSIAEAGEFMDLPTDRKTLDSKIKMMIYAKDYLRPRSGDNPARG